MRFTVFTPTYNRAHTLPRLYQSIRRQTLRDFEWIVVDDGSTDDTPKLVRQWQAEGNDFPIRYFWQPNQHKKVAFNRGVREAQGQWFVPIDSDDELLPDTLEQFVRMWESIPEEERMRYCAVVGLCVDSEGKIVGDPFPKSPLDADSVALFFDYRVRGEKFSSMRTSALRAHPFPEDIPNLVPESVVWFRMARTYTQRCFNIPVRIYHRDVESLTLPSNPLQARSRNAPGAVLSYAEALDHITWRRLIRAPHVAAFLAIQYGRFVCYLPPDSQPPKPSRPMGRFLAFFLRPAGVLLYGLDRLQLTEKLRGWLERVHLRFW